MYKLLPQLKNQNFDDDDIYDYESTSNTVVPSAELLCEAVFAGDKFHVIEAAYGRVDGVVRTATGYCGGTLKKPTYREVCELRTGHTEAVKVIYDKRKISYQSLCNIFWEEHDPTKKEYLVIAICLLIVFINQLLHFANFDISHNPLLFYKVSLVYFIVGGSNLEFTMLQNFGIDTHQRSAIFYCTETEKKQAQQSKIRKQMKLNKRIVTKITPVESQFFMAENCHQKFFLQKQCRLCECLGLRSTEQSVESDIACKLNGILGMEEEMIIDELSTFLKNHKLSKQTKLACEDLVEEWRTSYAKQNKQ